MYLTYNMEYGVHEWVHGGDTISRLANEMTYRDVQGCTGHVQGGHETKRSGSSKVWRCLDHLTYAVSSPDVCEYVCDYVNITYIEINAFSYIYIHWNMVYHIWYMI